ncbi:SDR family oxidoreductase [Roseimaritima ulvae]|nr:SDR family oxidoreductase [Roseimaritima ulvae]
MKGKSMATANSRSQRPVVVVTGASAGIGRATVRKFARSGYDVALIARGEDGLAAAAREVHELGGRPLILPLDVSNADAVESAAERVENELGPIDVWVNDAMVSVFSPIAEMTPEEFKRVTEVCYLGYVYGTLAALKRMRKRNRGTIVQVGSALAYRSIPLQSAYCAAKHAIVGFTDSLRCELLHEKSDIHVTVVQMPAVNTPQFSWVKSRLPHNAQPVPPIYQPEVAADAIYFAAHHRRREVWVGFSAIKVILGQKVAPGFADWYLARNGYASQQTDKPRESEQPNNLWNPVDGKGGGDFGARGGFNDRATPSCPMLEVSKARPTLQLLGIAGLGLLALGWASKKLTETN